MSKISKLVLNSSVKEISFSVLSVTLHTCHWSPGGESVFLILQCMLGCWGHGYSWSVTHRPELSHGHKTTAFGSRGGEEKTPGCSPQLCNSFVMLFLVQPVPDFGAHSWRPVNVSYLHSHSHVAEVSRVLCFPFYQEATILHAHRALWDMQTESEEERITSAA